MGRSVKSKKHLCKQKIHNVYIYIITNYLNISTIMIPYSINYPTSRLSRPYYGCKTLTVSDLFSFRPILWMQYQKTAVFVDGVERPVCSFDLSHLWSKAYYISIAVLFFFLPLVILVGLYGRIASKLLHDNFTELGISGNY